MRIAVYQLTESPFSIAVYADIVTAGLRTLGVEIIPFGDSDPISTDVDLYWDPTSSGGAPPFHRLRKVTRPLIVTVHGAAPMTVPASEYFSNPIRAMCGRLSNIRKKTGWRKFRGRYAAIIAVSDFARTEIVTRLGLSADHITVIAHGVAHERFRPAEQKNNNGKPFFLHLSQYQPLKNIRRMLEAYERISVETNIGLVIVAPGLPDMPLPGGVTAVREPVTLERAAELYRAATGFLFPSLRESFGMPILEAMASGCPVITSRGSACEETAGGAALLVDPRSVDDLAGAMSLLASDSDLREDLTRRGLSRAAIFSWRESAERHMAVFRSVLSGGSES